MELWQWAQGSYLRSAMPRSLKHGGHATSPMNNVRAAQLSHIGSSLLGMVVFIVFYIPHFIISLLGPFVSLKLPLVILTDVRPPPVVRQSPVVRLPPDVRQPAVVRLLSVVRHLDRAYIKIWGYAWLGSYPNPPRRPVLILFFASAPPGRRWTNSVCFPLFLWPKVVLFILFLQNRFLLRKFLTEYGI